MKSVSLSFLSLALVGFGQSEDVRRQEEYDQQMRDKYLDPVENFPAKMDQLLVALNRVTTPFTSLSLIEVFRFRCTSIRSRLKFRPNLNDRLETRYKTLLCFACCNSDIIYCTPPA